MPLEVISVSKDALAKVWDLSTQHCIQTLTGHRSEIWSLDVNPEGTRMVTGAADRQLRLWGLGGSGSAAEGGEAVGSEGQEAEAMAVYMGSMLREGNDRCLNVRYGSD